MKFALAYYFLLIYATVILKPLIPVMEDELSHCFGEAYHIATVHAKYGNNHLEKEIANTNDDANSNSKNTVKAEDVITAHVLTTEQNFVPQLFNPFLLYFTRLKSALQKITLGKFIPPPKISVSILKKLDLFV